jgi:hypothetical protein
MNATVLRWVPRILAVAFAGFLGLFALDVFGEGHGFWGTIAALAIHLTPTWLVLAALAVAWKHEAAGAALFFLLAATYVGMASDRFPISTILLIAGPPVVIGCLFLASRRIAVRQAIRA